MREENRRTQRKTLKVGLRLTETQRTYIVHLRMRSRVHSGVRHECYHHAILTPPKSTHLAKKTRYMYIVDKENAVINVSTINFVQ